MRKLKNEELGRIPVEEYRGKSKYPCVVVLDNIRSLHNVGSVFRTADAYLIEEILLCGITAKPPNREIHKVALGATDSVKWRYFDSTIKAIEELKSAGYIIIAIEQCEGGQSLNDFVPEKKASYAFVFGNEVAGVDQKVIDLVDHCIEIPQFGTKHSLNISVSVGVVIWDVISKMRMD